MNTEVVNGMASELYFAYLDHLVYPLMTRGLSEPVNVALQKADFQYFRQLCKEVLPGDRWRSKDTEDELEFCYSGFDFKFTIKQ